MEINKNRKNGKFLIKIQDPKQNTELSGTQTLLLKYVSTQPPPPHPPPRKVNCRA